MLAVAVMFALGSAQTTPRKSGFAWQVTRLDLWGFNAVTTFCPYAGPMMLKAVATTKDGRYETAPYTSGFAPLPDEALVWRADLGTAGPGARYTPSNDIFAPLLRDVTITASLRDRPSVKATLSLKANYGCGVMVDLRGAAGTAPGGRGGNGRTAHVALAYLQGIDRVVAVARVTIPEQPGWTAYYVLEPGGKPLTVNVSGGAGGAGGPTGDGGAGGDGGTVIVQHDAKHPELAALVYVDTRGGDGGFAGNATG